MTVSPEPTRDERPPFLWGPDITTEDDGETVVLRMSVHEAEDIAFCVIRHFGGAWGDDKWVEWAKRLDRLAEALDEDPRIGVQIVVVPR